MTEDEFKTALGKEYTATLKGSTLAYILHLLSAEQRRLDAAAKANITDIDAIMSAGANEIVGGDWLQMMYHTMGSKFISAAFGTNAEHLESIMREDSTTRAKGQPLH